MEISSPFVPRIHTYTAPMRNNGVLSFMNCLEFLLGNKNDKRLYYYRVLQQHLKSMSGSYDRQRLGTRSLTVTHQIFKVDQSG